MNVVPVVTGPRIPGKNHADQTFFHPDLVTDFELRFVRAACDGSMWRFLHLSYCDVTGGPPFYTPHLPSPSRSRSASRRGAQGAGWLRWATLRRVAEMHFQPAEAVPLQRLDDQAPWA